MNILCDNLALQIFSVKLSSTMRDFSSLRSIIWIVAALEEALKAHLYSERVIIY